MPRKQAQYRGDCAWCGAGRDHSLWKATRQVSRTGYSSALFAGKVLATGVHVPSPMPHEDGGKNHRICNRCYQLLSRGILPPDHAGPVVWRDRHPAVPPQPVPPLAPQLLPSQSCAATGLTALFEAAEQLSAQPSVAPLPAAPLPDGALPDHLRPFVAQCSLSYGTVADGKGDDMRPADNDLELPSVEERSLSPAADSGEHRLPVTAPSPPVEERALSDPLSPVMRELSAEWWEKHRFAHDVEVHRLRGESIQSYLVSVVAQVQRVVQLDSSSGVAAVRIFSDASDNTTTKWAALLTMERYVSPQSWPVSEGETDSWLTHIHRFDAGSDSVVYSNFPQQPHIVQRDQLDGQRRQQAETAIQEWTDIINAIYGPLQPESADYSVGHDRLKWQVFVPAFDRTSLDARYFDWNDAEAIARDLFSFNNELAKPSSHLRYQLPLHRGESLYLFFTNGGSGNGAHKDPVGGFSTLVMGWKVFIWWDAADGNLWCDKAQPELGIRLSGAAAAASLRWTLLGPGATIFLHPDCLHVVVTLTSGLLVSQCRTFLPHRLIRSIGLILTGQAHDRAWLNEKDSRRVCAGTIYPELLEFIVSATKSKVDQWRQSRQLQLLDAMAKGWRLYRDGDSDSNFASFASAARYKPIGGAGLGRGALSAHSRVKAALRRYEQLMQSLEHHN
jgi:hypothetical protein